MSKNSLLFSGPSKAAGTHDTYEVVILRKIPRYQAATTGVSVTEYHWAYTAIVMSEAVGFAVYEALYEYFLWRIMPLAKPETTNPRRAHARRTRGKGPGRIRPATSRHAEPDDPLCSPSLGAGLHHCPLR